MIELSQQQMTALENALRQAWAQAVHGRLVNDDNAGQVAKALMQGAYQALAAGEREERALTTAALAMLGVQEAEEIGVVVVDPAYVHAGNETVH